MTPKKSENGSKPTHTKRKDNQTGGMSARKKQSKRKKGFNNLSDCPGLTADQLKLLNQNCPDKVCRRCKAQLQACFINTNAVMAVCPTPECGFPFQADDMDKFVMTWTDEHCHDWEDSVPVPIPVNVETSTSELRQTQPEVITSAASDNDQLPALSTHLTSNLSSKSRLNQSEAFENHNDTDGILSELDDLIGGNFGTNLESKLSQQSAPPVTTASALSSPVVNVSMSPPPLQIIPTYTSSSQNLNSSKSKWSMATQEDWNF